MSISLPALIKSLPGGWEQKCAPHTLASKRKNTTELIFFRICCLIICCLWIFTIAPRSCILRWMCPGRYFWSKPEANIITFPRRHRLNQNHITLVHRRNVISNLRGKHSVQQFRDEETLTTINKFFENNLNVSETSRQLFVHRNTHNLHFPLSCHDETGSYK